MIVDDEGVSVDADESCASKVRVKTNAGIKAIVDLDKVSGSGSGCS
jgi:hypothetical protein